MSTKRLLAHFLSLLMLFLSTPALMAAGGELCAPFKDGKVDDAVLQTMLKAAADGRLYRIVPDSSRVGFCVNSRFQRVAGAFRDFQGGMALSKNGAGEARALVAIKTASVDTGGALIEQLIKSARFFDVKNYPEILFVSTGYTWTSSSTALLRGNLTLHGVTRPVVFHVTLTPVTDNSAAAGKGERFLVKATTTVSRADFGMDTLSAVVDDTVQLCMSVEARRFTGKV